MILAFSYGPVISLVVFCFIPVFMIFMIFLGKYAKLYGYQKL